MEQNEGHMTESVSEFATSNLTEHPVTVEKSVRNRWLIMWWQAKQQLLNKVKKSAPETLAQQQANTASFDAFFK